MEARNRLYSRRSAGSGLHFAADLGGGLLVQSAAWFRTIQGLGCEQLSDVVRLPGRPAEVPVQLGGGDVGRRGVDFDGAVCVSADSADGVVQGYWSERFLAGCRFGYYLVPAADEHVHHA